MTIGLAGLISLASTSYANGVQFGKAEGCEDLTAELYCLKKGQTRITFTEKEQKEMRKWLTKT